MTKTFPLAEAADALRYLVEGRPLGRVVPYNLTSFNKRSAPVDIYLNVKYLDIKLKKREMGKQKLEALMGGRGGHVFLVLWKPASAADAYAEKSLSELEKGRSSR